jgi:NADP-dependent aldehyde dehydrogenase
VRPLCYQNTPQELLPVELKDENPLGIPRLVNGAWTTDPVSA